MFTINGFIYQNSLQTIQSLQLEIEWESANRNLIINEMKELMFTSFHDTSYEV